MSGAKRTRRAFLGMLGAGLAAAPLAVAGLTQKAPQAAKMPESGFEWQMMLERDGLRATRTVSTASQFDYVVTARYILDADGDLWRDGEVHPVASDFEVYR